MAQTGFTSIQNYHSSTAGLEPMATNLLEGELAVNTADRKLFTKNSGGVVVSIASGAAGGGADQVFYENDQVVTANYTLSTGANAMTAGPITINSGVVVTIPSGSTWTVV